MGSWNLGIDTRALTRHLRDAGAMRVGIFSGPAASRPVDELLSQVRSSPSMVGADLTSDVTTAQAYSVPAIGDAWATVVAVDLGIKSMTPRRLSERGLNVDVVPSSSSWEDIVARTPDGIFFSNGRGSRDRRPRCWVDVEGS